MSSAASGPPCAAHHLFCEDFSGPSTLGRFAQQDTSNVALALDAKQYVSPPSAMLATTDQLNVFETRARAVNPFTATGRVFRLAWSEWVDGVCVFGATGLSTATIELPDAQLAVAIEHGGLGDWIYEKGTASIGAHSPSKPIPRNAWTRLELEIDTGTSMASLSIDGAQVDSITLNNRATPPQTPRINVGAQLDNIQLVLNSCRVWIDDVAFDVDP